MSYRRFDRAQRTEVMEGAHIRARHAPAVADQWPGWRSSAMGPGPSQSQSDFLSVIIPARNEAFNLPSLVSEIVRALRPVCTESTAPPLRRLSGFEIIVVDDGSEDATPEVLRDLAERYQELRPLRLALPSGQSAATFAGFRNAQGEWIGTLDGDLQNDPADLVTLWNALPGHDAVLGWRVSETHGTGASSAGSPTGRATSCLASPSATRAARCESFLVNWHSSFRAFTACTGFWGRSCCASTAASSRFRSATGHADRGVLTTHCGIDPSA